MKDFIMQNLFNANVVLMILGTITFILQRVVESKVFRDAVNAQHTGNYIIGAWKVFSFKKMIADNASKFLWSAVCFIVAIFYVQQQQLGTLESFLLGYIPSAFQNTIKKFIENKE